MVSCLNAGTALAVIQSCPRYHCVSKQLIKAHIFRELPFQNKNGGIRLGSQALEILRFILGKHYQE